MEWKPCPRNLVKEQTKATRQSGMEARAGATPGSAAALTARLVRARIPKHDVARREGLRLQ
jgi:hypothetical protein